MASEGVTNAVGFKMLSLGSRFCVDDSVFDL